MSPLQCELPKAIKPHLPVCKLYRWQLGPNKWFLPTTKLLDPIILDQQQMDLRAIVWYQRWGTLEALGPSTHTLILQDNRPISIHHTHKKQCSHRMTGVYLSNTHTYTATTGCQEYIYPSHTQCSHRMTGVYLSSTYND